MNYLSPSELVDVLIDPRTKEWTDVGYHILFSYQFRERFRQTYLLDSPHKALDPSNKDQLVGILSALYGSEIPLREDLLEEIDQLYILWTQAKNSLFEKLPKILGYQNSLIDEDRLSDIFQTEISFRHQRLLDSLNEATPMVCEQ